MLRIQMKERFLEWILASTSHGLPNFFRTNNIFLKILWLCCFLASTSYCFYSIIKSLQDFLKYPKYINSEIIQQMPSTFPAVSICNLKTFNKTAIDVYFPSVYGIISQALPQFNLTTPTMAQLYSNYLLKAFIQQNSYYLQSKYFYGFNLSSMLITCLFNFNDCKPSDFTPFYDTVYGNCYTFNKVNPIQVSIPSDSYGLQLELFVGDASKQTKYEQNDGIVLLVHNQTAFPMFGGEKLIIPTNALTNVGIERTLISKLSDPYSDCLVDTSNNSTFNSEFFSYIVNTMQASYDQELCIFLCMQSLIITTCGCQNALLPAYSISGSSSSTCLTNAQTECNLRLVIQFNDGMIKEKCLPKCPIQCDSIKYTLSTSSSTYPTAYYKDLLANHSIIKSSGVSYSDIDKSVLRVNVFYKDLKYTLIEEQPAVTTETFVSNLGGKLNYIFKN